VITMSEDSKLKKVRRTLERIVMSEGGKIASLTIASYLLGLTAGAVGKQIGGDWKYAIPAGPVVSDLMFGHITPYIIPYALGVATNYPTKVYEACKVLFS
jgi:hypothetical protein